MEAIRLIVLALILIGVSVLYTATAFAECVTVNRSLPELVAATPLVFVADVLKVETVILDPEPFVYRVRFRVLEAFKGTGRGEQVFEFGATAEDVTFQAGQRVLVYAHRNERGKFSTQCSATRAVVPDDSEILVLRRLSDSQ